MNIQTTLWSYFNQVVFAVHLITATDEG